MPSAARQAASASRNATMNPSPAVFTTWPRYRSIRLRSRVSWAASTFTHASSPSRSLRAVESSMSEKNSVTVPSAAAIVSTSARSSWAHACRSSIEACSRPATPCSRTFPTVRSTRLTARSVGVAGGRGRSAADRSDSSRSILLGVGGDPAPGAHQQRDGDEQEDRERAGDHGEYGGAQIPSPSSSSPSSSPV